MRFKVGDKVKVIGISRICRNGCGSRSSCMFKGVIGEITNIYNQQITVKNFKNRDDWCSGFEASVLELVGKIKEFGIVKFCKEQYKK